MHYCTRSQVTAHQFAPEFGSTAHSATCHPPISRSFNIAYPFHQKASFSQQKIASPLHHGTSHITPASIHCHRFRALRIQRPGSSPQPTHLRRQNPKIKPLLHRRILRSMVRSRFYHCLIVGVVIVKIWRRRIRRLLNICLGFSPLPPLIAMTNKTGVSVLNSISRDFQH